MGESKGICPGLEKSPKIRGWHWGWVLLDPQTSKCWPPTWTKPPLAERSWWFEVYGISQGFLIGSQSRKCMFVPVVSSRGIYNWNIPKNLGVFSRMCFSHLQAVMLLFPSKPCWPPKHAKTIKKQVCWRVTLPNLYHHPGVNGIWYTFNVEFLFGFLFGSYTNQFHILHVISCLLHYGSSIPGIWTIYL